MVISKILIQKIKAQNLLLELVQTLNPVLKGSEPNYYDLKCKLDIIAI